MNLQEASHSLQTSLSAIYDPTEAAAITILALEHLTGLSRSEQSLHKTRALSLEQEAALAEVSVRLLQHEPVQYIMNKAWFYGMELYVDQDVLIPRPETEELVDWIVKDVKAEGVRVFERQPAQTDKTATLKIMDVGTGSGCIALALKKAMPLAEVWGCDFSDRALNIARRNGSELDIRVDFQSVNFLDPAQQKHLPTVDIIVSNPPYVPLSDKDSMQPNVVQFEPHMALFVDNNDPLLFYRAIAQFGKHRLHAGGTIYLEIHENLAKEVVSLFSREGYSNIEVRTDMQGKERMVKARRITNIK